MRCLERDSFRVTFRFAMRLVQKDVAWSGFKLLGAMIDSYEASFHFIQFPACISCARALQSNYVLSDFQALQEWLDGSDFELGPSCPSATELFRLEVTPETSIWRLVYLSNLHIWDTLLPWRRCTSGNKSVQSARMHGLSWTTRQDLHFTLTYIHCISLLCLILSMFCYVTVA